jgi:hypothetical protein
LYHIPFDLRVDYEEKKPSCLPNRKTNSKTAGLNLLSLTWLNIHRTQISSSDDSAVQWISYWVMPYYAGFGASRVSSSPTLKFIGRLQSGPLGH